MLLLEREAQLASLEEYAADARPGDGRLVLIAGGGGRRQVGAGDEGHRPRTLIAMQREPDQALWVGASGPPGAVVSR